MKATKSMVNSGKRNQIGRDEKNNSKNRFKSFAGSAILEKMLFCSVDTTDPSEYDNINFAQRMIRKADIMYVGKQSPVRRMADTIASANTAASDESWSSSTTGEGGHTSSSFTNTTESSSKLFARALVVETARDVVAADDDDPIPHNLSCITGGSSSRRHYPWRK